MNTLTKGFAKRVISMLLVTIMVFSLGIVGLTSASAAETELADTGAQYNINWQGKVYFLAPASWDISTYSTIQVDITRTTSPSTSAHQEYLGTMTRLGTSRLFYLQVNADHSSWNQNEYIAFTANSYAYGSGSFTLNNNHYYTTPLDYGCNNSSNYYLFKPSSASANTASNGNTMTGSYSSSRDAIIAKQTVNITCDDVASSACGTVKMSGYYDSSDSAITSSSATSSSTSVSYDRAVQGSKMTLTATPKTDYNFLGWYSGSTLLSSSLTYEYTVFNTKTITAKFETATPPLAAPQISVTQSTEGGFSYENNTYYVAAGGPFAIEYTASHEETDVTYAYSFGSADFADAELATGNTWTYNGTAGATVGDTQTVTCYVWAIKDGVISDYTTSAVTFTIKEPVLTASAAVTGSATNYVDEAFTITVTDNSSLIGDATYVLYDADGNEVEAEYNGNVVTVKPSVAGTYTYYVVVTSDGQTAQTNEVTITVNPKVFHVTLSSDVDAILENRDFTITATSVFANGDVTYKLEGSDGTLIENNTDGIFKVTAKDLADGAGSENITYTVTANDGTEEVTATIMITVNEDLGVFPVKILFKCSDTYGYLPNATVNDEAVELTKATAIITTNASDSATYSWYSYTSAADVAYGTEITFAVHANRNYFYNVSYTVSAGEGDYEFDGTYYCYYLALENLNGGTNTLTNISKLEQKDWTESAVNMIYDEKDAANEETLAAVGFSCVSADYGDANCDGKLNVRDVTYIQKSIANMVEADELSTIVSDYNQDGSVTIKDATAIQKQLAGL